MEAWKIQNMVSIISSSPQEEPVPGVAHQLAAATDLRLFLSRVTSKIKPVTQVAVDFVGRCFTVMLPVRRGENEGRGSVGDIEDGMSQIDVDRSIAPGRQQFAVRSDSTMTVALALVGVSFAAMYNVPGGVNEVGRAGMGDTIPFIVFLVAATLAFHASLAVAIIAANLSRLSAKIDYFIRIALWVATVCLALTFHSAAYVVALPSQEWIVLCFAAAAAIELSLLLLFGISTTFS